MLTATAVSNDVGVENHQLDGRPRHAASSSHAELAAARPAAVE